MYLVYSVKGKTTRGTHRWCVGSCSVLKWGPTVQEALQKRCDAHAERGSCSAVWLRCCSDLSPAQLCVVDTEQEALRQELCHTLRVMRLAGLLHSRSADLEREFGPN